MSPGYSCDQTAILKVLLHSAKYPAHSVNGVLLGRVTPNKQTVEIVDAIPLLHSFLTLAPSLETALVQVSSVCCDKSTPSRVFDSPMISTLGGLLC